MALTEKQARLEVEREYKEALEIALKHAKFLTEKKRFLVKRGMYLKMTGVDTTPVRCAYCKCHFKEEDN